MLIICYSFYFCNLDNNNLKLKHRKHLIIRHLSTLCFDTTYSHIETQTTQKKQNKQSKFTFFYFLKILILQY